MRFARYRRQILAAGLILALFAAAMLVRGPVYHLISRVGRPGAGEASTQAAGSTEPTLTYPAGWWQRYTNAADRYSLALPPEWRVVPLDPEGLARFAAQGDAGSAQVAERLRRWAQEQNGTGSGLWAAIASDGALGSATTVNIIRQPLSREMPVDDFARTNVAALRSTSSEPEPIQQRWLTLAAGRALMAQMPYPMPGAEKELLQITQVYLVNGRDGYVLTAVTRAEQAEGYAPIFEGIVRSLRWTA